MTTFHLLLANGKHIVAEFAQQQLVSSIENLYDDPIGWVGGPQELENLRGEMAKLQTICKELDIDWDVVKNSRTAFEVNRLEEILKGI